jgi:ubiquinone/menaquinone biosynthesis C-methylase UbiE
MKPGTWLWILLGIAAFLLFLLMVVFKIIIRVAARFGHTIPCPISLAWVLDSPIRQLWTRPVLDWAGIQPGEAVLELGAGTGVFTAAAAQRVGPQGRLVAVDLQPEMIRRVEQRVQAAGLTNVETRVAGAYHLPLADESVDRAFLISVLEEIPDPLRALAELRRVLKPDGIVSITAEFIDPDYWFPFETIRQLEAAGFTLVDRFGNFWRYTVNFRKTLELNERKNRYIPALRFHWLTPLYDLALRWLMREAEIKRFLVEQMALRPGMHVLDLGCGTGTLTIMIQQLHPDVEVTGIDGDPEVLAIAREKAAGAGVSIQWDSGLAYDLPYADGRFDRIVSSLVIHHLIVPDKQRAFQEALRVLRPGGELHILDFGRPHNLYTRLAAAVMRHFEETAAQLDGRLPEMIKNSGFIEVEEIRHFTTVFGPLAAMKAIKLTGVGK